MKPRKSGRALEDKFVQLRTAKKGDTKKRPAAADGAGKATKVKAEVAVTTDSKGKPKMPTLKGKVGPVSYKKEGSTLV